MAARGLKCHIEIVQKKTLNIQKLEERLIFSNEAG